jgi:hypothetical protein
MALSAQAMIPEYRGRSQFQEKGAVIPCFWSADIPLGRKAAARLPHSIKISLSG